MALFSHLRCCLILPAAMLALSACTEHPTDTGQPANDFQVGRYRIAHIPGTSEVIEIDTATGKTWRLKWSDSDEGLRSYGWESLDD